jgi:eukaryotic translation initiation factor 2C
MYLILPIGFNPAIQEGHRRQRFEIVEKLQISDANANLFTPRGAFDGVSLFVIAKRLQLPGQGGNEGSFEVSLSARQKFRVKFTRVGEPVQLSALQNYKSQSASQSLEDPLNILQLLINQVPSMSLVKKGRSFFTRIGAKSLDNIELLNGFFQAIRPSRDHVMINIDLTFGAFHAPKNLIEAAVSALQNNLGLRHASVSDLSRNPNDSRYRDTYNFLKQYFRKLQVRLLVTKSKKASHTIFDIVPNAGQYQFDSTDDQGIVDRKTVEDYFLETYNKQLRYPDAFGVCLSSKNAQRPIIVPFELCELKPGQVFNGQLSTNQQRDMIGFATKAPEQRKKAIGQSIASGDVPVFDHRVSDYLGGMSVSTKMSRISGYMIPTPKIIFGKQSLPETKSVWNIQRKAVHTPVPNELHSDLWRVINFDRTCNKNTVDQFMRVLMECCRARGIDKIQFGPQYNYTQGNPQSASKTIQQLVQEGTSQRKRLIMAMIILPSEAADTKIAVKREADLGPHGFIAFCVRSNKVRENCSKPDNQYCNNMVLKLNSRLGGVNYKVEFPQIERNRLTKGWPSNKIPVFMVAGIDVNHPAPGIRHKPSVAALTYSMNDSATIYRAKLSIQQPRTEVLDSRSMSRLFKDAIRDFLSQCNPLDKATGKLKSSSHWVLANLIVFRDGVSESQYDAVRSHEVSAIKSTLAGLAQDPIGAQLMPPSGTKLTYVIVTKRHHVLNFPDDSDRASGDGKGNFRAGFTTHTSLAVPGLDEYYLQSHIAIKGTARPAHYIVLLNESFPDDPNTGSGFSQIEDLAFRLCHIYSKATRSVSIPAPVYYAHLACTRANYHFNPRSLDEADELLSQSGQGSGTFDVLEYWQRPGHFHHVESSVVINSMYFT